MIGRPRGEVVMTAAGDMVVIRPRRFELPVWAVLLGLLLRWTWRGLWWCAQHPWETLAVVVPVGLFAEYGWTGVITPLVPTPLG